MLIIRDHRYRRKYVYGRSGIFESISNFFKRLLSNTASTALARQAASAALDVGKTAATTIGNKLVDKAVNKLFPPDKDRLQRKFNNVIGKYTVSAIAIQDLARQTNGSGLKIV